MDPISTGWGDFVTKVIGEFAAGNQHDIFGTAIETFQTFAARGLVEPIDDFVAKNPNYSDFAPALFEDCKYEGKTYFVPTSWNNIMIHYNRDHFDKAGIAYPKAGWTWEEFREIAKKLTIKDTSGTVTQWGYEVPNQNFFLQPWLFSNGTGALTDDWSASNMLDPKVAESLQFLHDIIHVQVHVATGHHRRCVGDTCAPPHGNSDPPRERRSLGLGGPAPLGRILRGLVHPCGLEECPMSSSHGIWRCCFSPCD